MAKKRNTYRGGPRASKDVFSPLLPEGWINPQLVRATAVSDETLRSEYSRLRAIANKRLIRMAGRPEAIGTYERLPESFPTVRGMDRKQVVRALGDVSRFLAAERGSLSGIKKSNEEIRKSLKKKGIEVPKDQIARFGSFMNAMKKALGIDRGDYGSEQLAELWSELFDKGKISQAKFEKRVKELMKEIEEEKQKEYTRSQKIAANKVIRDRPISEFFASEALDPRTIAAQKRKDEGREALQASRRARAARARRRR